MKIFLILLLLLTSDALGHEGEDHGTASTSTTPAATGSQLKLVSYQGSLEVFVKYPAPILNEPVSGRLFFADYASNRPVNPAGLELSFPGALGAKITKQPTKISDGVFEFTAIFVRDTGHTALLRYTYGNTEQLASLSPFYAGTSAERQMMAVNAASSREEENTFPTWTLIPIALGLLTLAYVLFRRRRKRLLTISQNRVTPTTSTTVTETKIVS
jgi:hypothetical protein